MSERERAPRCRDTRGSSGGARVWAGQPDRPPRSPSVRLRARRPLKTRLLAGAIRSTQPMISITTKSPYALHALAELGRSAATARCRSASSPAAATSRSSSSSSSSRSCAAPASCAPSAASRAATPSPATPREITVLEVVELLDGPLGRDAEGIFAEAAAAARDVLAPTTDRRRRRARGARGRRGDVLHLKAPAWQSRDLALRKPNRPLWNRSRPLGSGLGLLHDCYAPSAPGPSPRGRLRWTVAAACASTR